MIGLWNDYNAALGQKNYYEINRIGIFTESIEVAVKHARRYFGIKGDPYYTYHTEQRFNQAAYDQAIQTCDSVIANSIANINQKIKSINENAAPEKARLKNLHDTFIFHATNDELLATWSKIAEKNQSIVDFIEMNECYSNQTAEFQQDLNRWGLSDDAGLPIFKKLYDIYDIKNTSQENVHAAKGMQNIHDVDAGHINELWNVYNAAIDQKSYYENSWQAVFTQSYETQIEHKVKNRILGIRASGLSYYTKHTQQKFNQEACIQAFQSADNAVANASTALNQKFIYLNDATATAKVQLEKINQAYQFCVNAIEELREIMEQQQTFMANSQKNYLEKQNTEFPKILKELEGILVRLKLYLKLYEKYEQNYKFKNDAESKALSEGNIQSNEISQYHPDDTVLQKVQHLTTNTENEIRKKHAENIEKTNKFCSAIFEAINKKNAVTDAALKKDFEQLKTEVDQDIVKFKKILSDGNDMLQICLEDICEMLKVMDSRHYLRKTLSMFAENMEETNALENNDVVKSISHSVNVI